MQYDFEVGTKLRHGLDPETQIDIREKRVYAKADDAADWVFAPGNSHKGLIVELKVESSSQYSPVFATKVVNDQKKVAGAMKDAYKDYDRTVLAIAWKEETKKALKANNMVAVEHSTIHLKKTNEYIQLYQWTGESATDEVDPKNPKGVLNQANPKDLANPDYEGLFKKPAGSNEGPSKKPDGSKPGNISDNTRSSTMQPITKPITQKQAVDAGNKQPDAQTPFVDTPSKPSTRQKLKNLIHGPSKKDQGDDRKGSSGKK